MPFIIYGAILNFLFIKKKKTILKYTVKMNMLYLINKIVATDYKQYYLLN